MEIEYSVAAARALRRCDKRKLVRDKIELLARDPLALNANVKRLSGLDAYRLRVQNWRVLFKVSGNVLEIKDILPRGSAYED